MAQMTTITTGRKARCAMACCQSKRLSLMRSLLKRCGLCDARRPFGKKLKCSVCKIAFHRLCATKEVMCKREPADGSHVPDGICADGDREHFPAHPDTTTVATAADVNRREHVTEDATEAQAEDATEAQAEDATEVQVEDAMEAHSEVPTKAQVEDTTEAQVEDATNAQAEDDTGSPKQILSIESTPVTECSGDEKITWSEYFEYLVNNTSEDEKLRPEEAMARASRPSPMLVARSSFTQTDYLELSAAWDEVTLRKSSRRCKPFRTVVHSTTIRNTVHHGLKRVRFGRDPSLMSDR